MTELPNWLARRADTHPRHPALITAHERIDYAGLLARASAVAARLQSLGVSRGDRVALLGGNTADFAVAVHGISLAGGVLVPLNTRLTAGELEWQLGDASPRALLVDGTQAGTGHAIAEAASLPLVALPVEPSGSVSLVDRHDTEDLHSIIYTSGTTGQPKGAMLTYGNIWWSAVGSAFNLGTEPEDRWLACMPLFHVGGLSILLRSAIAGSTVLLHETFDEARANHALRHEGVTLVSLVATMLQRMLAADELPYPETLRAALIGGGPVPPALLEAAASRGMPVVQTYGMTETASQVATLSAADAPSHLGSAGKPLLTMEVRIDAPAGEPGEILVRGPNVSPGYFNRPEATAHSRTAGWFRTGDIGRLDDDGYLFVLDRRDDLVVTGGENVYPAEVEAVLRSHPAVTNAAVVGLPDTTWGNRVAAAVVTSGGVHADELRTWTAERLAGYKVPKQVVPVEELPTTASGKVQRHRVRDLLSEGGGT